ncbi:S-adenosyl-L-methionine-dependent methyltransferase [Rickenella mellea]|uniref:S-adenosyl-L-methionine-dependent methyltransferase n=1 Tax=Rickenella mellea TaxID=50990 RepID=A0A4Y7PWY8_9AGAM|nr:S-adenosyl-L-methionine-dependent methyltransferase [Rickenella mellea]
MSFAMDRIFTGSGGTGGVRSAESENDADDRQSVFSGISDAPSIYSFNSSRDGLALLRLIQGRTFNAQNDLYYMPADMPEFARQEKEHFAHLVGVGRLYVEHEKVQRILSPTDGEQKRILDLGTGVGTWAIGMAQEFPHAEVIGLDLAPNTASANLLPPNCRFEFDDFNLGLPHFHNSCDIIHGRIIAIGMKDFKWFITEVAKCLKPGGMFLMVEGDHNLWNSKKELQELAYGTGGPGQSWYARAMFEAALTMQKRGSDIDARMKLYELISSSQYFEDAGEHIHVFPIGPWEQGATPEDHQRKQILGILERQSMIDLVQSLGPLFISEGYPKELVDQFIKGTEKELNELTVHMYIKWFYFFGTRNSIPIEDEKAGGNDA